MLVDVVELRRKGLKLPKEVYSSATPIRGKLVLSDARPGRYIGQKKAPLLAGLVVPGGHQWMLPPLDEARVTCIREGSILVIGQQQLARSRDKDELVFDQAWWCRVVSP